MPEDIDWETIKNSLSPWEYASIRLKFALNNNVKRIADILEKRIPTGDFIFDVPKTPEEKPTIKEELIISNVTYRGLFPSGLSTLFEDQNTHLFSNIPVKALKSYEKDGKQAQTITVHSWFREKVEWYKTDKSWEELLA